MGYTVRTKEVKEIQNKEGKSEEKCNLDIEIVIDMFNTVNNYDKAIIFSGDSDFERAIELLRSKGKTITVISTEGMIAWDLVNAADDFIDIKEVRAHREKTRKGMPRRIAGHFQFIKMLPHSEERASLYCNNIILNFGKVSSSRGKIAHNLPKDLGFIGKSGY